MKMSNLETPKLDFSEPEWNTQNEYVRSFIQNCLQVNVNKRMDIHQLMHLPLLKIHRKNNKGEVNHPKVHQLEWFDACCNLQWSNVLHEILHRQVTINESKMNAVRQIAEDYKVQSLLGTNKVKKPSLPIEVIRKHITKYLDEIETDRLFHQRD